MPEQTSSAVVSEAMLFAERIRLTRDASLNFIGYALSSIGGIVLVPLLLHGLTRELYGVWIAATALQYTFTVLNGGLGRGVAREVAACSASRDDDSITFVRTAGLIYAAVGIAGMGVIALVGLALAKALHVSAANLWTARLVFALAGVAFFGDQVQALAAEILTGLRKFPTINFITVGSVIIRTAGIIVLIALGHGLVAIAAWHAVTCVAAGLLTALLAFHDGPQFRPGLVHIDWRNIKRHAQFSLISQVASAGAATLWRSAPFLVGFARGPAAIVPYEVGQKFPLAVTAMVWQVSDVMFPAASEYHRGQRDAYTRQLLVVGTRGVLFLVLPAAILLWMLAPHLLAVWLRTSFSEAELVLRLTIIAFVADCVAAISIQLLWAQDHVDSILKITTMAIAISLAIGWPLLYVVGNAGAAIGLALGVSIAAARYIVLASRTCNCSVRQVLGPAIRDLWRPSGVCILSLIVMGRLHSLDRWPYLMFTIVAALLVYAATFYLLDSEPDEKVIVRSGAASLLNAFRRSMHSHRRE